MSQSPKSIDPQLYLNCDTLNLISRHAGPAAITKLDECHSDLTHTGRRLGSPDPMQKNGFRQAQPGGNDGEDDG
jgi:hypothetical protein